MCVCVRVVSSLYSDISALSQCLPIGESDNTFTHQQPRGRKHFSKAEIRRTHVVLCTQRVNSAIARSPTANAMRRRYIALVSCATRTYSPPFVNVRLPPAMLPRQCRRATQQQEESRQCCRSNDSPSIGSAARWNFVAVCVSPTRSFLQASVCFDYGRRASARCVPARTNCWTNHEALCVRHSSFGTELRRSSAPSPLRVKRICGSSVRVRYPEEPPAEYALYIVIRISLSIRID